MGYIFISYRKSDVAECLALARRLKEAGFDVWWDEGLPPGSDFFEVLDEKVRNADAVITLWTKHSVRSKWVYFETDLAARMSKLVPLKLEACEIPVGLNRLQTYLYRKRDRASDSTWAHILSMIREAASYGQQRKGPVPTLDEITWSKISTSSDPKDYEDYLSASTQGRFADEALASLQKFRKRNMAFLSAWIVFGLIIYIAILTPGFTLVRDFGPADALFWATLYFDYFLFFPIFGTMIVPIYFFTLAKGLSYGFRKNGGQSENGLASKLICVLVLVLLPLFACAGVTLIETGSGYAPWQFSAEVLDAPIDSFASHNNEPRSLKEIFERTRALPLISVWDTRNDEPTQRVECLASGRTESESDCRSSMIALKQTMLTKMRDTDALSLTDRAYIYSFAFFALTFLGTYFNIVYLCAFSERVRAWMAGLAPWGGQRYSRLLYLFAAQLLFISVWFVARLIFQMETKTLLPSESASSYSEVIRNSYFLFVAVFFVGVYFLTAAAFRLNSMLTRLAIVSLAIVTAVFLWLSFSVTSFVTTLQFFIGVKAAAHSEAILAIILIFVVFIPLVVPNMLPRDEDALT